MRSLLSWSALWDEHYTDYVFNGDVKGAFPVTRATIKSTFRYTGGKLTRQFATEVSRAMFSGDIHPGHRCKMLHRCCAAKSTINPGRSQECRSSPKAISLTMPAICAHLRYRQDRYRPKYVRQSSLRTSRNFCPMRSQKHRIG